jgi:hypothetical protein
MAADNSDTRNSRAEDTRGAGKVVSTPEGDNEYAPDQPLTPTTVDEDVTGLQQWPSNSRMEYDKTKRTPEDSRSEQAAPHDEHDPNRPKGVQRVIDEISTGKILPG